MNDNGAMRRSSGARLIWRVVPYTATLVILVLLGRRVPLRPLLSSIEAGRLPAISRADGCKHRLLRLRDTLLLWKVMSWFHQPIPYRELLPARAASYHLGDVQHNLGTAVYLAYYLTRRTDGRFLQLGSTVMFLTATEFTHLIGWATAGVLVSKGEAPWRLLLVAPVVALTWLLPAVCEVRHHAGRSPWPPPPVCPLEDVSGRDAEALHRGHRPAYSDVPRFAGCSLFRGAHVRRSVAVLCGIDIPARNIHGRCLPVTVAHLGTTQAAWVLFFGRYAIGSRLLAFSLAAHLSFIVMRVCLSLLFAIPAFSVLFPERARSHLGPNRVKRCPLTGHSTELRLRPFHDRGTHF